MTDSVAVGGAGRVRNRLVVGGLAAGMVAGLAWALWFAGGAPEPAVAGLPDAGPVTGWGLPVARLLGDAAGAVTVGATLAAAVLLPATRGGRLSASGRRCLRAASTLAWVWCAAAVAAFMFTVSDVVGRPLPDALSRRTVSSVVGVLPQAKALLVVIALTSMIALWARAAGTLDSAAGLLVVAAVALLPPVVTGHAHGTPNHDIAVVAIAFHVLAAAQWAGGLGALAWQGRRLDTDALRAAAGRFSRVALWCFVVVAASGVVNAWVRLPTFSDLVASPYGLLVAVKAAALVAAGVAGAWHRRRTIPALAAGGRGPLLRLAAVEVAVLAAATTLGAALSRTPPPSEGGTEAVTSPAVDLLGFELPPPVTAARLVTEARPDLLFLSVVAVGAGLYLAGLWRMRARGLHWPAGRTAAWLAGLALVALATSSGLGTYGRVLFSVHMAQHLLLAMAAPILLVLGAPVTLALRALPAATDSDTRTARQWVVRLVHSRPVTVVAHPAVALALFVGSMFAVYFSPVYPWMLDNHLAHLAVMAHFLASGCLFFWVLIGIDPGPARPSHPARVMLLFIAIAVHAFFGVAVMQATGVLGADYYAALERPWGHSPLDDQRLGGGLAWSFGELPALAVLAALFAQWARADERAARQLDRRLDSGADDTLDAYNQWLADLHAHDTSRTPTGSSPRERRG